VRAPVGLNAQATPVPAPAVPGLGAGGGADHGDGDRALASPMMFADAWGSVTATCGGAVSRPVTDRLWLEFRPSRSATATEIVRVRGESSTVDRTRTLSGAWTFLAGPAPRIGLVARGGATAPVTARFDCLRVARR
jgi:hypothetical protein